MAKLGELYTKLDRLQNLGEDVTKVIELINKEENNVLSNVIIPTLRDVAEMLLKNFRNVVSITIDYSPESNISITSSSWTNNSNLIINNRKDVSTHINSDQSDDHIFYVKTKTGAYGIGVYDLINNSFTLLKGSKINPQTTNSFNRIDIYKKIISGFCDYIDGFYVLKENYEFASPSTASSVVLGRSSNGWTAWKDAKGHDLNEVYRLSLKKV